LVSFFFGKLGVFHDAPLSWWLEKAINNSAACLFANYSRVALTNSIHES